MRTRSVTVVLSTLVALALVAPPDAVAASRRDTGSTTSASDLTTKAPRHISQTRWGPKTFADGRFRGASGARALAIGRHPRPATYRDPYGSSGKHRYDRGLWTSPWQQTKFGMTELVASYNAKTPVGTFIDISARGRTRSGKLSSWDSLGRWAGHDRRFHRMSLGEQGDDLSSVEVDTLVTDPGVRFARWQLRIGLMRRTSSGRTPVVNMVAGMASRLPSGHSPTSQRPPHPAGWNPKLRVPKYSQEIHAGEYPQWNGGGEAWCSPTSTAMVVAFWGRGPSRRQLRWVKPSYDDPQVDYAARYTYASGYDGTGNWPFNTAYAARFDLEGFVTRLRSLREAELFINEGIPLVATISFDPGELDGAPISQTAGHLVVIRGFTSRGRVIVNDPAADSNRTVLRRYNRRQFEHAWIGGSGGVVYVIHPRAVHLPKPRAHSNW